MVDKKELFQLGYGDVLRYKDYTGQEVYFIVKDSNRGEISGSMASPTGINIISIDELVKKEELEILYTKRE